MVPISTVTTTTACLELFSALFAPECVFNLELDHVLDAVSPVASVRPDSVVGDQRAQVNFTLLCSHVVNKLAAFKHHV